MDYRIIYFGAQTMIGILFLVLYSLRCAGRRGQRPEKLDAVYGLFIITILLDSIWILIDGVPKYRTWHILLELVYLSVMAHTGYLWFLYTLDLFPAKSMLLRRYRYILGIPVLFQIALILTSVKTGLIFIVDENGTYIRGSLSLLPVLMNYCYMLLGSYVALTCRKEALLTIDKRRFTVAALFPVPVLFLSGAQMLLPPGLPTMQGGVLVALLLLYGTSQNLLITRDYLTGLPNRSAFEQDLLERLRRYRADGSSNLYLMEGDLDSFKQINDTYGHPAGDTALRHAADALRLVFSPYGAVVFRTGGDEFMVIAETDVPLDTDLLRKELNKCLLAASENDPVRLSMSLGIEKYDGRTDFRALIESADRKLYEAKRGQ
ncbi:MAG: GGDEF domain-containing protein [Lachnospiraceae bacterium]|nr:GGDEF domain-containing protein [Lachnospiraceae bacterium]